MCRFGFEKLHGRWPSAKPRCLECIVPISALQNELRVDDGCLFMAPFGPERLGGRCPFAVVKLTSLPSGPTSENDPTETLAVSGGSVGMP
jgi:hypothetical protein